MTKVKQERITFIADSIALVAITLPFVGSPEREAMSALEPDGLLIYGNPFPWNLSFLAVLSHLL